VADDLRVNGWLVIPASELRERFSRSSGPGGQSVNTADTRVELSFDVAHSSALPEYARARVTERLGSRLSDGVLTVVASEQRSQLLNRRAARGRLAALLREAIAPPRPPRVPTRPGRAAKERRIAEKRQRGAVKRGRRLDIRDTDLSLGAAHQAGQARGGSVGIGGRPAGLFAVVDPPQPAPVAHTVNPGAMLRTPYSGHAAP
jgi:ribosome-associated protein